MSNQPHARLGVRNSERDADAEFQRGFDSFQSRNLHEALSQFYKAESFGYHPDSCAGLRWQCWMMLGELERAWRESDALRARGFSDKYMLWDGESFTGRSVIIRCLHGYGDAIQFLRYAPMVRASAKRVMVETHPEMVSVLNQMPGIDEVVTWAGEPASDSVVWDQQIEVMELPRIFRSTVQSIPREVPYMNIAAAGKARLPEGFIKVGLVWAASSWNPLRSVPLAALAPVLMVQGILFLSFQRGAQRAELEALSPTFPIFDTVPNSPEILDTACDFLEIDLLITVDTMAAHLAGALGRPVWLLLPFQADWRWMIDREDSPWYPTMRLFRQSEADGGWACVVTRLAHELSCLVSLQDEPYQL